MIHRILSHPIVSLPFVLASLLVAPQGFGQGTGDWQLVWADEFSLDGAPDPASWSFESGFVRNQELQWYQPQNAIVTNGLLVIEGRREQVPNPNYVPGSTDWKKNREFADYTSASLKTRDKFSWRYGRLEVRARIETQQGLWPAIWTLGVAGEWPSNGECDVMEFYRRSGVPTILANTAWGTATRWVAQWDGASQPLSHFTNTDPDWVSKFHIWRMDWDTNGVDLYLDDELMNHTDLSQTLNADGSNPFQQPHYLLLNLAIGSNGGDPSSTPFPRRYEIDYARVYESTLPLQNWVKVDDRAPEVSVSAGWGTWEGNPGYQETERFSETAGAEITFSFEGSQARYYGFRRGDLGYAEVLVDGVSHGTVDCHGDPAQYDQLLFETPELPNTLHTLTVRVTGTNNPASSGTEVIADAFASRVATVGLPWQQRWFTETEITDHPEISGAGSDADTDGVAALLESVYGGDPRADSVKPRPRVSVNASALTMAVDYQIERLVDLAGVTAATQFSTNLVDWVDLQGWPGLLESNTPSESPGYETRRFQISIPVGYSQFYLRSVAAED